MTDKKQESIGDRHYRRLNDYRDDPDYRTVDGYEQRAAFFAKRVGIKWEINEALYDEFLDMLPPLGWRGDIFYLAEFLFDDITHKFTREGSRFFCEVAYYPPRPQAATGQRPDADPKP